MLAESSPEIKFIGVGRLIDQHLVATLARNQETNRQESAALMQAALAVLDTPDFSRKVLPGAYHSLQADVNVVHFTVDGDASRIYLVIAAKDYPRRVVFELISKLQHQFLTDFAVASMTCAKNGLSTRARPMLHGLMDEFSDLGRKDTLFKVTQQVKEQHKAEEEEEKNDVEQQQQQHPHEHHDHGHGGGVDAGVLAHKKEKCRQYQTYGLVLAVLVSLLLLLVTRLTSSSSSSSSASEHTLAPTSL